MKVLRALISIFKPHSVGDGFFGQITYMKTSGGKRDYWEGRRAFGRDGGEVEVFIDAPAVKCPPGAEQQRFFLDVEDRVDEITARAGPMLREASMETSDGALRPPSPFRLTSFSVPCAPLETASWSASFELVPGPSHLYTVEFAGVTPVSVAADG